VDFAANDNEHQVGALEHPAGGGAATCCARTYDRVVPGPVEDVMEARDVMEAQWRMLFLHMCSARQWRPEIIYI